MHYVYLFFIFSVLVSGSVFYNIKENVAIAKNNQQQELSLTNPSGTEVLLEVVNSEDKESLPIIKDEDITADKISISPTLSASKPKVTEPVTPKISQVTNKERLKDVQKVTQVPFYSQFADISSPNRKKVGCGVASLAMLIELYNPDHKVSVDQLFEDGLRAGAYLNNAGWIHSGLINLSKGYGLDGQSHDLAGNSGNLAFEKLKTVLDDGPVMVSVHYTFEPTNPIPHLVVINSVSEDGNTVYYNDPAESTGNGSISKDKFIKAWKKRYIEIRPA